MRQGVKFRQILLALNAICVSIDFFPTSYFFHDVFQQALLHYAAPIPTF